MTNNTREVEEVVKEFYKIFDTDNLWQGEDEWTKNVPIGNIEQWLRTTLHHQLQKAREDICRNHLETLEDALSDPDLYGAISGMVHGLKEHLSHSEIDQAEPEGGLVDKG